MKKLLNFLLIGLLAILSMPNQVSAAETPVISNLRIEFSSGSTASLSGATFRWNTYNTDSTPSVDLTHVATNQKPTGTNCSSDSKTHCFSFANLITGQSYRYTVKSIKDGAESSDVNGYSTGTFTASVSGGVTPGPVYEYSITPTGSTSKQVSRGGSSTYQFQIRNTGNTNDTINLSVSSPSTGWSASISPSSLFVKVGEDNVFVNLTIIASTTATSSLNTIITATSQGSSSNSKTTSVTTTLDAAPSTPANLTASALSTNSIRLSWSPSTDTDSTPVSGYEIYNASSNALITSTTSTSYDHTGLTASTSYSYRVRAYDTNTAPKNYSEFSSLVSAVTLSSSTSASTTVNTSPSTTPTPPETTPPPTSPPTSAPSTTPPPSPSPSTTTPPPSPASATPEKATNLTREVISDGPILIQGKVVYPNGSVAAEALVSIWGDNNSRAQVKTGVNGEFSFQVARSPERSSKWRLSSAKTNGNIGYRSTEITVEAGNQSVTGVELALQELSSTLPPRSTTQSTSSQRTTATLTNGATIDIPPAAIAASTNITLDVKPTVEVPEYSTSQVVGLAYDIVIKDQAGVDVKTFTTPIEITFPYDDATLIALGITAESLAPSYYDETTGAWVNLTIFTVDKINKRIVAKVNHLTRFALIAAADVTAPASPTLITATRTSTGVLIRWANPSSDFRHAKIYRSTESGKLGTVVFAEVAGTFQVDANAPAGSVYYIVRAVDPAGNESANTNQVTVSSGGVVGASGLVRSLRVGLSGNDVKLMQQILVKEGVYLEGFITGRFGRLTEKAVLKFQEKYKDEVLKPAGLTAGNGFVGPRTLKKLIELKAKYSL